MSKLSGAKEVLMIELRNDKYQPLTVQFVDDKGKPAKVDGVPVWASSDTAVAELKNVGADGMSAEVWPIDAATGVALVTCTADADLGAGTISVKLELGVQVVAPQAVGGAITPLGSAIDKP